MASSTGNPYVIDLSGPQNALSQWAQQNQQARQMAQQQSQFNATNALARDQFGEQQKQHGITNALARDQFGLASDKNYFDTGPSAEAKRQAEISQMRAHAAAYDALANVRQGRLPPSEDQPDLGMREDGTLYEIAPRVTSTPNAVGGAGGDNPGATPGRFSPGYYLRESRVLGDVNNAAMPPPVREHASYGRYDVTTPDVPGLVTRPNPSRTSDKFGTQTYQGQRAIDAVDSDADRARLLDWKGTQDRWTTLHGKQAPAGFAYNPDGSLRDLKDESKKAVSRDKIGALVEDVKTANEVFQKTTLAGRGLASASGGWVNPVVEQAARSVEHAVQFMTAEIEGKRHANAQDVRMLKFFSPQWNDSAQMIGFKLDQFNRIMQGYFGAKTQSGELFKSELAKANEAYHKAIESGQLPRQNVTTRPPPSGQPIAAPVSREGERFKNKYGLE